MVSDERVEAVGRRYSRHWKETEMGGPRRARSIGADLDQQEATIAGRKHRRVEGAVSLGAVKRAFKHLFGRRKELRG